MGIMIIRRHYLGLVRISLDTLDRCDKHVYHKRGKGQLFLCIKHNIKIMITENLNKLRLSCAKLRRSWGQYIWVVFHSP